MASARSSGRQTPLLCLLTLVAAATAGCGGHDPSSETVPRLIAATPERVATLMGAPDANTDRSDAGAAVTDTEATAVKEVPPSLARGSAGFTTHEQVDIFVEQCRARPARTGGPVDGKAQTATGVYGRIYEGAKKNDLPETPRDNVFRWVEGNPEFLDPNKIAESAGTAIAMQLFETLLVPAPGNTPPRPGQAARFEVSEDGKTYTFYLRPGLVWSDGTPIDAETFRGSWLRGLDPKTASKNAQQLWTIQGAQAFNTGQTSDPTTVAIRADGLKLEVDLKANTPYFPDLVTYVAYAPVPLHVIAKHEGRWTRVENMAVNGPFKMTQWQPRDRIVMTKNPRYWDADAVSLDGSIIFSSDSESKNEILYNTGQAHWIKPLGTNRVKGWIQEGRQDLRIDELMCTYYYVLNTQEPPFDDPRIRRAFNMAVDKGKLTTDVLASFQKSAPNLLMDMFGETLGYVPVPGDPFDPQGARDLLAAAGYPGGAGFPKQEIIFNTFEVHRQIAVFVGRNLQENLGVPVTIANMEWKSLLKRMQAKDFTIGRTSWCADYPDPYSFLEVFHSDSANNYPQYKNPAYDALLARIIAETDRTERNALLCAAEKTLNRDVPIIPFYFYTRSYMLRPEVQGFLPQYLDHHYLKWVSLAGEGGK